MTTFEFAPTRRTLLAGGAGLGALSLLAACGASGPGQGPATDNLIVAWPADADSLDAQNSSFSGQDWDLWVNLYEVLLTCKYVDDGNGVMVWDGTSVAPGLAKSWETKDDTIIFHLDETRKFYPSGNPVTADDVLFSFQRMFNMQKGALLGFAGVFSMDQITKIDTHTLQVKCLDSNKQPQAAGAFQVAVFRFPDLSILDSVEVKKHATASDPNAKTWLMTNTAGTGPYYVKNRQIGQSMVLQAVPGHPLNPAYKTVTIQVTGNILSVVKGGSVDVAVYGITDKDVAGLEGNKSLDVQFAKAPEFYFLEVPVDPTGPLGNKLVRQALAQSIPYDEIVKSVFGGRVTKDLSIVAEDANGYTPAWSKYTGDIAKAKALMSQAGNPKVSVPLRFENDDPARESMAILIKSAAAQAGIEIVLMPQTAAQLTAFNTSRMYPPINGAPDLVLHKYGVWIDDPSITMQIYAYSKGSTGGTGLNFSHYSNPRIDEIVTKWYGKPPTSAGAADWKEAQETLAEDLPIIPISHSDRVIVTKKGITGVTISPEMCTRFYSLKPPAA